jgi:hypothetical protein
MISPGAAMNPMVTRNSSNVGQMENSWEIYKRYSNFYDLSEALKPYFEAEEIIPPKLPPKI